ncbi:MAG: SRPBCC family protein [Pseudomonadota bacterium]
MSVTVSADVAVDAPASRAFDAATRFPPPDLMRAHWPMPGCASFTGPARWLATDEERRLVMTDGNTLTERLVAFNAPMTYETRITGFHGWFARLAAHADVSWTFETVDTGAAINWRVEFAPRDGASPVMLAAATMPFWPAYMRGGLKRLSAAV